MQVLHGDLASGTGYTDAFTQTADTLVAAGQTLGAHVDTHAKGDKSNCGSIDGVANVNMAIAQNGDALTPLTKYLTNKLGFAFDADQHEKQVENAGKFVDNDGFASWSGANAITEIENRNGVVQELDGGETTDPTHGHHENLVVVILRPNVTLDKESLAKQTGKQVFFLTLPEITELAKIQTSNPDALTANTEVATRTQAGVLFQLAHALTVPDGSQYLCVIE